MPIKRWAEELINFWCSSSKSCKGSKVGLDQVPSLRRNKPVELKCSEPGQLVKIHLIARTCSSSSKNQSKCTIDKNTDWTHAGLYLISRPTPVPCARDSVTQACTDSRARKPLQLRDKSATLSRAWVVIVRHFNHARRGRALAAISGKVPSVSGVWNVHFENQHTGEITSSTQQNSSCSHCAVTWTVTMCWLSSHLLEALVEGYKTVYLCHLYRFLHSDWV